MLVIANETLRAVLSAAVFSSLLIGCQISRGKCDIPGSDAAIERSLKLSALSHMIQRNHIRITPAAYLIQNPSCCSVKELPVSFFDWLLYDRYSAPRYEVQASMGYRDGPTVLSYSLYDDASDVCGRLPDPAGDSEIIDGPAPAPECALPPAQADASAPRMCIITEPRPKEPVSLSELARLKEKQLGPIIDVQAGHR